MKKYSLLIIGLLGLAGGLVYNMYAPKEVDFNAQIRSILESDGQVCG